jgi:hypothetical protein
MGLRPRAVPPPARGLTSADGNARLEIRLTVPTGKDGDAASRALVHALARLAVSKALAQAAAEEDAGASGHLRALLD